MRRSDVCLYDADPLTGQIGGLRDGRVARCQDPLVRQEVDRGEVDQLAAFAGDRHGLDDDVDLIVLQGGNRSADDRIRYSTCDGVPKMSRATSPAMSTSNR